MLLGVDIGGTTIKAAIVDHDGSIRASRNAPTPRALDDFYAAIEALIHSLCGPGVIPQGVGIGCKGIIDPVTSRVEVLPGTVHYLEGQVLSELVAPHLPAGVNVAADNDARAALAGEVTWGAARGRHNVVMLTLGTGVGGAMVVDGKLVRGSSGVAGHLGHYTIDPEGPLCICGNRGCVETYFSACAIESEAYAAVRRGVETALAQIPKQPPSCADVFAAAAAGDAVASGVIRRSTSTLSAAIAGLIFIFDPELVVLAGQISTAGEALFAPVRQDVAARTGAFFRREIPILPSQLEDRAGVIGAAALALNRTAAHPAGFGR